MAAIPFYEKGTAAAQSQVAPQTDPNMGNSRLQKARGPALEALLMPLQIHTLPHLTPRALAALRRTCKTMTHLVDSATGSIWQEAVAQMSIPPQLVPIGMYTDGTAVQSVLRNQAATLRTIRCMRPISAHFSPRADLAGGAHRKLTWLLSEQGGGPHLIITDCSQRDEDRLQFGANGGIFAQLLSGPKHSPRTAPPSHRIVPMLVALDVKTAQTSVVKPPAPGCLQLNAPIMLNAHHVFDSPNGGHLFVGMAEAWGKRCTQQMLLYKLGDVPNGGLIPGGALHLAWQAHVTWTSCLDKGEPAPPACSGTMLAMQVDNLKVSLIDLSIQKAQARFNIQPPQGESGWVTDLAWSSSGRYLAVRALAANAASVEVWNAEAKRRVFHHIHNKRASKADNPLLWADSSPSLIFITRSEVQVLRLEDGPPSLTKLHRHQTGIHINMVHCRWDPTGEFIAAAAFKDHLVHLGPAFIFAADSGDALHSFEIDGHATWPVWLPPAWSLPKDWQPAATSATIPAMPPECCTSWCILPRSQRLAGFSPVHNDAYTSPWVGGPHTQLSPNGSILIALMVIDGPHLDSHKRRPQALTDPFGYALGFRHRRLRAGTQGEAGIESYRRNKPAGATNGQTPQAHPFLMAWLPGTRIYAAAALGYIYIIDTYRDRVLSMWEDEATAPPMYCVPGKAKAFRYRDGTPIDLRRLDRSGRDGCQGLTWSPDRAHLVIWSKSGCGIISFGAKPEVPIPRRARLEPQLKHEKLPAAHMRRDVMYL